MKIKSKLFTSFILLILIFLISFFVNQRLSQQVVNNSIYLNNSETVIRNSNLLHKYMIEMQSGFRGYLLTQQESFLQPYYRGLKDIPPITKEQYSLISSAKQKERLDFVILLHNQWILYANVLISTRKDTLPGAMKKYQELFETKLKTEVGKKLNDEIQLKFAAFDAAEYQLRQKRRIVLQESISSTRKITLWLMIFSITIAIITAFYIVSLISRRIKKMVTLAEEISKGNFKKIEDDKQDELTKLSESLNTMSETLEKNFKELTKKNKELDQFAYVVSHDLKAPLRGIDNITKWMEEDHSTEFSSGVKKNIDLIKGRTKRLESMINGLLEYARIGRVKKDFEDVNVESMLRDLVDILVPSTFTVVIQPMPILLTERLRLEQVFSNLLGNAVKYHHKEYGKINIHCREVMGFYEFSISDDGPGIEQKYHEKIFMIFQTLRERDAFESTGVGLAIVKKIVEEQKAVIHVESEPGKGSTFKFTWPKSAMLN